VPSAALDIINNYFTCEFTTVASPAVNSAAVKEIRRRAQASRQA
jgi:hypothetical protein